MINFLSSTNEHSCNEGTKRLNAQELQKNSCKQKLMLNVNFFWKFITNFFPS